MVFSKVIVYVLQVRCGGGSPPDAHFQERNICSRRASISSSFYELAAIGLGNPFPDRGPKAGDLLQQTQGGVFHQTLGVGPCLGGDLRKLRFLLRREMYFHGFRVRENQMGGNAGTMHVGTIRRPQRLIN
jgi:hypothetical protein